MRSTNSSPCPASPGAGRGGPAGRRRPAHAAARGHAARQQDRRAAAHEGRIAAAHRLIQVPRRLSPGSCSSTASRMRRWPCSCPLLVTVRYCSSFSSPASSSQLPARASQPNRAAEGFWVLAGSWKPEAGSYSSSAPQSGRARGLDRAKGRRRCRRWQKSRCRARRTTRAGTRGSLTASARADRSRCRR